MKTYSESFACCRLICKYYWLYLSFNRAYCSSIAFKAAMFGLVIGILDVRTPGCCHLFNFQSLTLSTPGKIFSRGHIEIFFLFSHTKKKKKKKKKWTFHAICLQWRQFACKVKSSFLGKIREIPHVSSAELAHRVIKVKLI